MDIKICAKAVFPFNNLGIINVWYIVHRLWKFTKLLKMSGEKLFIRSTSEEESLAGTPISKSPSLASIREHFDRTESFSSLSAYAPPAPGSDRKQSGKYCSFFFYCQKRFNYIVHQISAARDLSIPVGTTSNPMYKWNVWTQHKYEYFH